MKRAQRRMVLWVLAVAAGAMMPSNPLLRAQEFDEERLRAGADAYQSRRYTEAIALFRVAAFGSLDRPPALSQALARLALAESAAGRTDQAEATLSRFLEIERRFGVYTQNGLDPETRAAFQALLFARVPPARIAEVPSLARLVETEEQKIAKLPPAERRKAFEAAARREPGSPVWPAALAREALSRSDTRDAERWAGKALALDPRNADALATRARARVMRGEFAAALQDLSAIPADERSRRSDLAADRFVSLVETRDYAGAQDALSGIPESLNARPDVARARQKLEAEVRRVTQPARSQPVPTAVAGARPAPARTPAPAASAPAPAAPAAGGRDALAESRRLIAAGKAPEAVALLERAVQQDPSSRPLRLALLEAAALSRAYSQGAAQLPLLAPFAESEAGPMFYAAIVLYETGKGSEARRYLERAAPRVSGQLVDEYSRKILGQP